MDKTINDHTLAFGATKITPRVRFLASLSDGRTVIQDNRADERHAWVRLSKWLKDNNKIFITGLRLQGPNGIDLSMPNSQLGYFFGLKKNAVWGAGQWDYVGIGYYDGQTVNICWHRQPLFNHSFSDERTAQQAGFFLIEKI